MKREKKQNTNHITARQVLCRLLAAAAALVLLLTVIPGFGEGAETAGTPEQAAPFAAPAESVLPLENIRARLRFESDDAIKIVDDLVPLNLSCEDEGIRLEIIAGAVKEQQALFVYSLQDPEGDQINEDNVYPLVSFPLLGPSRGVYSSVDLDRAGSKITYLAFLEFDTPAVLPETITAGLSSLTVEHTSDLFIQGMLEKYGSKSDLVDVPEILDWYPKNGDPDNPEFYTTEDYRNAGVKVLDYKNPLSVRLHRNLELSGIAVADGELHVQVHYLEKNRRSWPVIPHSIQAVWVDCGFNGEYMNQSAWQDSVRWNTQGDSFPEYQEFIFPWKPKEGDRPVIRVRVTEVEKVIPGDWHIDIPLADVLKGSVPPAEAAGTAPAPAADPVPYDWQDELEARLIGEPAGSAFPVSKDYLKSRLFFSAGCQSLVDELLPVHRTCESKGIRMEIIAAAMNQANGLVIYSLEDLEGNRINEWSQPTPDIQSTKVGMTRSLLDFDESTGKALYYLAYDFEDPGITDIPAFHLGIMPLDVMRTSERSILGLLQKYGSRAEFTDVPETLSPYPKNTETEPWEYYTIEEYRNEGIRVLDYTKPLSVRLSKDLELSGIGILDGKLHVQLHYINGRWFYVDGIRHPKYGYAHAVRTVNGSEERFFEWNNNLSWDADGDGQDEFKEFIIPWDDPEGTRPGLRISLAENIEVIDGDWSFEIPMQEIWVGEGGPAEA